MSQKRLVWKYPLPKHDKIAVVMPKGAVLLHFAAQEEQPTLWAWCDPEETEKETRRFLLIGTGREVDTSQTMLDYVGTAQFLGGQLIFHLFEIAALVDVVFPDRGKAG
jgi:hypothetical protein